MNPLLGKLQYANETQVLVLHAPEGFESQLETLRETDSVDLEIEPGRKYDFVMAFVVTLAQVNAVANRLDALLGAGDPKVWMAYPKGSSKRYRCEFNRDTGWQAFGEAGFEPVRQVAVDEDWSALRFRRVEFIKSMKRDASRAVSATGKARTKKA